MNSKDISLISAYDMTKAERSELVAQMLEQLDNGTIDPLKVHKQVKCMEDLIKQLTGNEQYKQFTLDAAAKYGKSFELYGAKFQIKEAGTKYDYSQCNDAELNELQADADRLAEKIKKRQDFLKLAPIDGIDVLDDQSGEVYKLYPPAKTSTTTISITLP